MGDGSRGFEGAIAAAAAAISDLVLVASWNWRLEANQGPALFGDVIFDELSVFSNHVFGDAHVLELLVEGPPFRRRLILVVEDTLGASHSLFVDNATVRDSVGNRFLSPVPSGGGLLGPLASLHGVVVLHGEFGGVFVAALDPFEKVLGLGLVLKEKPHGKVLDLKAVEEESVLRVLEVDPELLVPQHSLVADDVDQLEKKGMSNEVVHEDNGSREPRPRPFLEAWVVHIEPHDGGVDDLVRRLRDDPFDLVLVCGREGGHRRCCCGAAGASL